MPAPLQVGFLLFPDITQLDLTGPAQVFDSMPDTQVHLVWKDLNPVASRSVIKLIPTTTLAACPQLDVLCVPGGYGTDELMNDEEVLSFLRVQAEGARYVTSVCTGSTVLAAAGLLKGYRATSHWSAMEVLPLFGAIPVHERVCIDRNRVTGGGCTAGIDFAFMLASLLFDRHTAESIQLDLEYDPAPPFDSGSIEKASDAVLTSIRKKFAPSQAHRMKAARAALASTD